MGAAAGWGAIAGAGLGLLQNEQQTKDAQRANAVTMAETRAAPLFSFQTGQKIEPGKTVQAPGQFDSALQGAIVGAGVGSSYGQYKDAKAKEAKDQKRQDEKDQLDNDIKRQQLLQLQNDNGINTPNLFDANGKPIQQ